MRLVHCVIGGRAGNLVYARGLVTPIYARGLVTPVDALGGVVCGPVNRLPGRDGALGTRPRSTTRNIALLEKLVNTSAP